LPAQGNCFRDRKRSGDDHEDFQGHQFGLLRPAQQDHLGRPVGGLSWHQHHQEPGAGLCRRRHPAAHHAGGFDVQGYLLHSLVVAGVARQLGVQFAKAEVDPGDCYVAGLLHDFGKIVLAQFMPAEFHQAVAFAAEKHVPLHEAENWVIGANHGVVGAMLASRWTFPVELVDCIRAHHDPASAPTALMDCLRTADQIVRLHAIGNSGNPWRENEAPAAPDRFGDNLDALVEQIGSLDRIVAEAMSFVQVAHE
jgi:putative nucleotidyltransferase with HDIG domain